MALCRVSAKRTAAVVALGVALAACGPSGAAGGMAPPARALRGGPFVCEGDACVQAYPAYPDDGEWECIELSGLVICRGGIPPAGVRPGAPDSAFACGAPLGRDEHGRRVCIDAAPDVPDADASAWLCRFDRDGTTAVRRCDRAPDRPGLGAPCPRAACPAGTRCDAGRCALADAHTPPDCWLDEDCEGGATCVLARCSSP